MRNKAALNFGATFLMLFSSIASAGVNNGTVVFTGSVSAVTCDVKPVQPGGAFLAQSIQLGNVKPSASGTEIKFNLEPVAGQASCNLGTLTTGAEVSWVSNGLSNQGIDNQTGTATGAYMTLKSDGATKTDINLSNTKVDFTEAELTANNNKMPFVAQLHGGTNAGTFVSAASFVVAYK